MNKKQIKQFLAFLNVTVTDDTGAWQEAACPLGPWKHKGAIDANPSFGILETNGRSPYKCWSCASKGTLEDLVMELMMLNNPPLYQLDLMGAMQFLEEADTEGYTPVADWEDKKPKDTPFEAFPLEWLNSFPSALGIPEAMDYLKGRGMSVETITSWDAHWDSQKKAVCFPYYYKGVLAGMRGRYLYQSKPKYHDYVYKGTNNSKRRKAREPRSCIQFFQSSATVRFWANNGMLNNYY